MYSDVMEGRVEEARTVMAWATSRVYGPVRAHAHGRRTQRAGWGADEVANDAKRAGLSGVGGRYHGHDLPPESDHVRMERRGELRVVDGDGEEGREKAFWTVGCDVSHFRFARGHSEGC